MLEDGDCESWKIIRGRHIVRVLCSKFCKNELLRQHYELLDSLANARESTPVKTITKTLCECKICHGDKGDSLVCNGTCCYRGGPSTSAISRASSAITDAQFDEHNFAVEMFTNVFDTLWDEIEHSVPVKFIDSTPTYSCPLQQFLSRKLKAS